MIYGGGVISRQVNTRRTERRSSLIWLRLLMIYGGDVFSVKLTPDERNAGAFCYGFDLMIYGGDVFSVKLTPDERNAGAFDMAAT